MTIFFIGGGGGGGITKSLPGLYYLKLDINLIVNIGIIYSLGLRNRWQQVITGDLLLLPSNGHGREALVPRVYSAFKMAALSG